MITKDTFLVSFNIQGEGFCEPFLVTYRTEELNPYLRYPRQTLNPNHLHVYFTKQVIRELMGMPPIMISKYWTSLGYPVNPIYYYINLHVLFLFRIFAIEK